MFSVMFALETAARKPAIIRSSNSRSPLPVRIVGIRYPDTSLSRSDGYEHLTTAQFTISSVNGKIWLCTKMAERRGCDVTCNRSIDARNYSYYVYSPIFIWRWITHTHIEIFPVKDDSIEVPVYVRSLHGRILHVVVLLNELQHAWK